MERFKGVLDRINRAQWEYEALRDEEQMALLAYVKALEAHDGDVQHEEVRAARERAYEAKLRLDRAYVRLLEAREAWEKACAEVKNDVSEG